MGLFDKLKETLSEQVGPTNPTVNQESATPQNEPPSPASVQPTPAAPATSDNSGLYDAKLEQLIDMALADGELSEKEKMVLFKRAETMGIDLDEFEMVLDARYYQKKHQPAQQTEQHTSQQPPFPKDTSSIKSNKYGDVKKCPACGATIDSLTLRCPECNYEFRNIKTVSSITTLFDKLQELEEQKNGRVFSFHDNNIDLKKRDLIERFPIPSTKEDIIEFLSMAAPLSRNSSTWTSKCAQVVIKARIMMKDDPETLAEVNNFAKQYKIIKT